MKSQNLIIYILLVFNTFQCLAQKQKPVIDSVAYKNWATVGGVQISNDGKFVIYTIDNEPTGSKTTVLKSTDGKWEKKYTGTGFSDFSGNGKTAVFDKAGGGLYMVKLKDKKQVEIPEDVRFIKELGMLTYLKDQKLIIEDPITLRKDNVMDHVKEYRRIEGANGILITRTDKEQVDSLDFIWYDLHTKRKISIWKGNGINNNIVSSVDGRRIAFIAEDKLSGATRKVCVYQYPDDKAEVVFEENKLIGQKIENLIRFCANSQNLIVTIKEEEDIRVKNPNPVDLNIWSYKDNKLQPKQLMSSISMFTGLINGKDKTLTPLTEGDEYIRISNQSKSANWGLISTRSLPQRLNDEVKFGVNAVSLVNGKRIKMNLEKVIFSMISPDEKFIIYYDFIRKNYFSYELSNGITRNITDGIKADWEIYTRGNRGIPGWTEEDKDVLIYDRYDIWQVDPLGKRPAKNLTHQFGLKNNIRFNSILNKNEDNTIEQNSDLYLTAFDLNTYENGFYKIERRKNVTPKQLFMGEYLFYAPDNIATGFMPLKAKSANAYVVKRMNARESPNYYSTRDFKNFTELSGVYPEREWNWLSSKMHVYDQRNKYKGALYKPENFDPSKKYPVILNYYERLSDKVNEYEKPGYSHGMIDIPTFVSRGYLVFCPDIEYEIGFPGESALKCVTAAADYLSTFPYVDKENIGINGHSFGGFETNYIVTHSSRFKAACSGASLSDLISFYGSVWNGDSRHGMVENGQMRIGKSLWENKELFIKNSPIFDVNKVNTPLLIFHGNTDEAIPVTQAIEFFIALHRLGKPAWLLQYMNVGHVLFTPKEQRDFTIRLQQFFDCYLRGAAPPKWMTMGRPAKLKGIDERLELDVPGLIP